MQQQCNYRVSVKAAIIHDGKLLVISGENGNPGWELPGGGLEHNETIEQALNRELQEEIGVTEMQVKKPIYIWPLYNDARNKAYMHIICPVILAEYPSPGIHHDITIHYADTEELATLQLMMYGNREATLLSALL